MSIPKIRWLAGLESVLLTLWIGGLCVTGYLVVPTLFSVLDDRQIAGLLAGKLFQTMNYVGLGIGTFLLISVLISAGEQRFNLMLKNWRVWVIATMLLVITVAAFVIQPMMQELKLQGLVEGSMEASQFGRLHGVSSILFLLNSLLGLLLVGAGLRKQQ